MKPGRKPISKFDLIVCLLILVLGALQFFLARRAPDYLHDANYFELANSIIHHASYGFNGKPMTQLPPGLPYLMASLNSITGIGYTTMLHLMTVFAVLALFGTYKLLCLVEERPIVSALACLLLGSSPFFFIFATSLVFADLPYFALSVALLLIALSLDRAIPWRFSHTILLLASGPLLAGTVLLKSVGLALLTGLIGWLGMSCFLNWETGKRRLKIFLPMLTLGVVAQVGWMVWASHHQYHEWPLPGYQENYVAQLRLKNANEPELGLASWKDVLKRPIESGDDMSSALFGLYTHKEMAPAWYSPGTLLPLALVLIGLAASFLKEGGGLLEWYFLSYQAMFLLWPWDYERRFFFPIAPFAFLYAWRGGVTLWNIAHQRTRILGIAGLTLAATGTLSAFLWGKQLAHPSMWACVVGWILVAAFSLLTFWVDRERIERLAFHLNQPFSILGYSTKRWLVGIAGIAAIAFTLGVGMQTQLGLNRLRASLGADDFNYPEIEAAHWIAQNTPPSSVVMARKDDMIFHYSNRRVVWFPASRDAEILMAGIQRHHVEYVVIHDGNDSYWRPPAKECFEALLKKYPDSFELVHSGPHNAIYQLNPKAKSAHETLQTTLQR